MDFRKGDILVAGIEELENLDVSEIHARRLNAKGIITPSNVGIFMFPNADGTVQLSGGDQGIRKCTSTRDRPERGEVRRDDLRGDSDESQPMDTMMDDRRYIAVIRRSHSTLDVLQESRINDPDECMWSGGAAEKNSSNHKA